MVMGGVALSYLLVGPRPKREPCETGLTGSQLFKAILKRGFASNSNQLHFFSWTTRKRSSGHGHRAGAYHHGTVGKGAVLL